MKLHFLGANKQVTGSRYLLEVAGSHLMVDCGMFQERAFLCRNWEPSPVSPATIDHLLLTHAHLDHSGLIPRLVREGFHSDILTTAPSRDLAEIILEDSADIQEEDARYKKKRHEREHRRGPHPEEALYSIQDVEKAMRLFRNVSYSESIALNANVTATFHDAGHILGSAMIELTARENGQDRTILFSGDLGQCHKPIIRDPTLIDRADYVVMESTYGNRDHDPPGSVEDQLARVVNETVERGGNIVIPTFAVERAQELIYHLGRLIRSGKIPDIIAFLDSPMAVDATAVFQRYSSFMDAEAAAELNAGASLFKFPGMKLVQSTDESRAINRIQGSCVIMAGSGMCNAGRIKHHLVQNIGRGECTILFVGYQSVGTLGREILDGNPAVRIFGTQHAVKARVEQIVGLSAHADRGGLLKWLGNLRQSPKRVFLTHGENDAAAALAEAIRTKLGWQADVPNYQDSADLLA